MSTNIEEEQKVNIQPNQCLDNVEAKKESKLEEVSPKIEPEVQDKTLLNEDGNENNKLSKKLEPEPSKISSENTNENNIQLKEHEEVKPTEENKESKLDIKIPELPKDITKKPEFNRPKPTEDLIQNEFDFDATVNGSFWDDNGNYFNRFGLDIHGGYYDKYGVYFGGEGYDELKQCYPDENDKVKSDNEIIKELVQLNEETKEVVKNYENLEESSEIEETKENEDKDIEGEIAENIKQIEELEKS